MQVASAQTQEELQGLLSDDLLVSLAVSSGYCKSLRSVTMDSRDKLVSILVTHQLIVTRQSELDQLSEGLQCCGFLDLLSRHPKQLSPLLLASEAPKPLAAADLLQLLPPQHEADRHSNQWQHECDVYDLIARYLEGAEGGCNNCHMVCMH